MGIEVFQDVSPDTVDRPMRFVDHDQVERFRRQLGIVGNCHGLLRDRLFTEIFPGRSTVPKTLIFAKDDARLLLLTRF